MKALVVHEPDTAQGREEAALKPPRRHSLTTS